MEILCLIIAIIIVVYRKYKGTIGSSLKKFAIKTIALALSFILIITIMIKEVKSVCLKSLGKNMKSKTNIKAWNRR